MNASKFYQWTCSTLLLASSFFCRADALNIEIFGDMGTGTPMQYKVGKAMFKRCQQSKCDFILGLGDNIYNDGVSSVTDPQFLTKFERPYQEFGHFPFYMTLGNHDYHGDVQSQIDYSAKSPRWRMPAAYYLVPHLPAWIKIMVLDTMQKTNHHQWEMLEKEMCSFKGVKIIAGHHPMWSVGSHGNDEEIQELLWPIIKKCHIHFVFNGHDHDQEHMLREGVNLFIQGAGAKSKTVDRDAMEANLTRFASATPGFALFNLDHSTKNWKIQFFNDSNEEIYTTSGQLNSEI